MQVTLKFIVCETLAASAVIEAYFCDQREKARGLKLELSELDSGDCTPPFGSLESPWSRQYNYQMVSHIP